MTLANLSTEALETALEFKGKIINLKSVDSLMGTLNSKPASQAFAVVIILMSANDRPGIWLDIDIELVKRRVTGTK